MRSPYIGLFYRPCARTRKIELVEMTAKQIEDEHEDEYDLKELERRQP